MRLKSLLLLVGLCLSMVLHAEEDTTVQPVFSGLSQSSWSGTIQSARTGNQYSASHSIAVSGVILDGSTLYIYASNTGTGSTGGQGPFTFRAVVESSQEEDAEISSKGYFSVSVEESDTVTLEVRWQFNAYIGDAIVIESPGIEGYTQVGTITIGEPVIPDPETEYELDLSVLSDLDLDGTANVTIYYEDGTYENITSEGAVSIDDLAGYKFESSQDFAVKINGVTKDSDGYYRSYSETLSAEEIYRDLDDPEAPASERVSIIPLDGTSNPLVSQVTIDQAEDGLTPTVIADNPQNPYEPEEDPEEDPNVDKNDYTKAIFDYIAKGDAIVPSSESGYEAEAITTVIPDNPVIPTELAEKWSPPAVPEISGKSTYAQSIPLGDYGTVDLDFSSYTSLISVMRLMIEGLVLYTFWLRSIKAMRDSVA